MPEKRPLPNEGSTALVEASKRQKLNEMVLATQKGNQVVQAVSENEMYFSHFGMNLLCKIQGI